MTVSTSRAINRTPDEILAFVMDARAYQRVDPKIRPVLWMRRRGDVTEFTFMGMLAGLPTPPTMSRMTLTPGERVDVCLPAHGLNRLARLATGFTASFVCTPHEGDTLLVRTLTFDLRPPLNRLERWLRPWLVRDVEREMDGVKRHLEGNPR